MRVTKPKIDAATGLPVYTKAPVRRSLAGPVECIDETIAVYIGSPPVAAALHVYPNLNWAVCGSNSSFNYVRTEADERIDVYPTIVAGGVRVMIYNGEADACVPYIDNESASKILRERRRLRERRKRRNAASERRSRRERRTHTHTQPLPSPPLPPPPPPPPGSPARTTPPGSRGARGSTRTARLAATPRTMPTTSRL
jgi:hypothetical protein